MKDKIETLIGYYNIVLNTTKEIQEEYKNEQNDYMEGFCKGSAKTYTKVISDLRRILEEADTE